MQHFDNLSSGKFLAEKPRWRDARTHAEQYRLAQRIGCAHRQATVDRHMDYAIGIIEYPATLFVQSSEDQAIAHREI